MPPDTCEYHALLVSDLAVLKNDTTYIRKSIDEDRQRTTDHINEGEREGGFRDRLRMLEGEIAALKKAEWLRLISASVLGGLFARLAPDAIGQVFNFIVKAVCKV